MKKTPNSSTLKKKSTKKDKPVLKTVEQEYYKDMFSFTRKITDDYLQTLALEWVNTAMNDDDMLVLEEYQIAKGVHTGTFYRWMKRCPELQQAHDHVLAILGCRREKGAITKKYDPSFIAKSMAIYNTKWKEIEEWRANMSAKIAGEQSGFRIVEVQRFEDCPLVPHKKEKE